MQSFIYQDLESAKQQAGIYAIPADIFIATNLSLIGEDKSGLSVKAVRELIKMTKFAPNGDYRVIIIPNSEKMLAGAQNALLKTLEEPPEHTLFFLVTNNPSVMLDTILSRCEVKYSENKQESDQTNSPEFLEKVAPAFAEGATQLDKWRAFWYLEDKSDEKEKYIREFEIFLTKTIHKIRLGQVQQRLSHNGNWKMNCKILIERYQDEKESF